ncbi:DUF2267 domain-containing protein [Mesorhizobium ventifaucium]|uniref:DUF2267 domain-containing protein n=1 Tax=Mesorhizobium ventifaucium TaxID=666020 RepID=UPI0020A7C05C|nr:DUF2267 domain-containing protein [Mesorhizobium ventifaucium]
MSGAFDRHRSRLVCTSRQCSPQTPEGDRLASDVEFNPLIPLHRGWFFDWRWQSGGGTALLVRGAYYDRYRPRDLPTSSRSLEDFLQRVAEEMKSTRPVNPEDATRSVFKVLARHVDLGQSAKVRDALPKQIRALWPESVGV